jgi:Arc/MetJ-type ribon-helix-helix transcriptional regulator
MHRIQVQLTANQERQLREMARLRGQSISALIREGVDALLAPARKRRQEAIEWSRSIAGTGRDKEGKTDVSERHDYYLAQAIYEGLDGGEDDEQ